MYQFVQSAGDTVFVPGGWWHAVLNMEDTVAMTQNFCSRANFSKVWREARSGRKKMSVKWLKRLHEYHPDLAQVSRSCARHTLNTEAEKGAQIRFVPGQNFFVLFSSFP